MKRFGLAIACCAFACAMPVGTMSDAATTSRDGAVVHGDGAIAVDAGPDLTGTCVLGTGDNCGMCGTVCPPGMDNAGTLRTCSTTTVFGMCDITCKGEFYDLDGDATDGCEAEDQPVQDTPQTAVAVTLADVTGVAGMNPQNLTEKIYSDMRTHDAAPTQRPLGRDDWWAVTAVGTGDPQNTMVACLGITNYPTNDTYEVCISDAGNANFLSSGCAQAVGGGASVCVHPPAMGDAGGPYYVRVRKLAGANTLDEYALFLNH